MRDSRRHQVSWQLERRVLSVLRVADSGLFYCPFSRRNGRALQNQVEGGQDCLYVRLMFGRSSRPMPREMVGSKV